MTDQPYTINEFCAVEKLSRSQLYKLWHQGKGPRFYKIGNRPRISSDARTEWRQQMEKGLAMIYVDQDSAPSDIARSLLARTLVPKPV